VLRSIDRVVLCGFLLATIAPAARAQFGIKGGVSFSDVTNSGALPGNPKERNGFAAGVGMAPSGILGFGAEALYAQRGVTSTTSGDSRQLDYVDLPVYLRAQLPIPGLAPFAYAGPQWSYELKCRTGSSDCPASDRPRTTYAGVIGAGVHLAGLSFEGRYVYGLSDLKLATVTTSSNYQTRSFLVLAGIGF
jgi:hypothetical protein